jgi:hypothetical protein
VQCSGAVQCLCSAYIRSAVEWCMQWCGVVQWNSAVHAVVWCIQWCGAVYAVMWFIQWCSAVQCCAVVCGAYSGAGSG